MKLTIVGAGVNGLYLAWKLAEKGNQVTVFERKAQIGKNACSGLFSERILEFVPQSRQLIENEINAVLIHFPKRTIRIDFSKKFFVMSHFDLDNLVAKSAIAAGAKITLGRTINSLSEILEDYDRVIGCDGSDSIVRKNLKIANPSYRLAIQGFTDESDYSNNVEAWPVDNGFIWRIPRGRKTEYGIVSDIKTAKPLFDEFVNKNSLHLENPQSAVIPQGLITSFHPSITICGDAAGLTKPWSGGGVIWGLVAAEMLLKSFPDFSEYQETMSKFFKPKIAFSKIMVKTAIFLGHNIPWILPKKLKIESDFLF